jgi:transcriptional repressor NrdR
MKCPYCGSDDSRVVDSRDTTDGVRRRRECIKCQARFTTYERLQPVNLYVIKKDQRHEEFNKEKLLSGIRKACEKRPLTAGAVEKLADDVESELIQMGKAEIPSSVIGDMVMKHLKNSIISHTYVLPAFIAILRTLRISSRKSILCFLTNPRRTAS